MSILFVELGSVSPDDLRQALLLLPALAARGRQPLLAAPAHGVLAGLAAERGVIVEPLPAEKMGPGVWWALKRCLRNARDPVTLVHTLDEAALTAGALLGRTGLPWVHTLRPPSAGRFRKWALRRVDMLADTGIGPAALAGVEVDATRIRVVPPAAADLQAPSRRRERGDGRFIFVAAGPLTPDKDWHSLLQAMAYLQNMAIDLPEWEVRVAGGGPLFSELLESAEKLGVERRLSLLGPQDRRDFLPDADAVVAASSSGGGDAPLVLDAWACGVPVACTSLPPHLSMGEEKVSLLLSPPANAVALAGSMLRLMQEPGTRIRLAEGGRTALERFRPALVAEAYDALYEEAAVRFAFERKKGEASS